MKPDPNLNGRYIEGAKGIKLFMEEVGDPSTPSILFIHGIMHSRLSWMKQFESGLAKQFHPVDICPFSRSRNASIKMWQTL